MYTGVVDLFFGYSNNHRYTTNKVEISTTVDNVGRTLQHYKSTYNICKQGRRQVGAWGQILGICI